MEVSEITDNCR